MFCLVVVVAEFAYPPNRLLMVLRGWSCIQVGQLSGSLQALFADAHLTWFTCLVTCLRMSADITNRCRSARHHLLCINNSDHLSWQPHAAVWINLTRSSAGADIAQYVNHWMLMKCITHIFPYQTGLPQWNLGSDDITICIWHWHWVLFHTCGWIA